MAINIPPRPRKQKSHNLQEILQTATAHHEAGELDQAIALYETLIAHIPENPEIHYLYGSALLERKQTGDIAASLNHLELAAAHLTDMPTAHLAHCESLIHHQRYDQAESALLKAEALNASENACGHLAISISKGRIKQHSQHQQGKKNHTFPEFYLNFPSLRRAAEFYDRLNQSLQSALEHNEGVYIGDNLITFDRNLGFLQDETLMQAFSRHTETDNEKATLWRVNVLLWAARQGLNVEGDFIECGCYRGTSARIICDMLSFSQLSNRKYYLYDLFEHNDSISTHHSMPAHSETLVEKVRQRFTDSPNVRIIQGCVPDSLIDNMPEKIAFMHIDLNNLQAELGALEMLFDRLTPGGILILDDYGWGGYAQQHIQESAWMRARGHHVLELPTGQGMVIKH